MATQTLEFSAGTGLTLTCKLFAVGSDTVVDTQTATEKTNDINRYSVSFTDVPAGAYRLNAFVGATGGFANEVYDLTLTTSKFYPRSESAGTTAEEVADAVWDESYADHKSAGSFGKLMDIIRKANLSIDGEVEGTPTVNTFDTNLTDPTTTHDHQLLVFTTGALEGISSPILSYSQSGGQIILQEDLPSAPSSGDEFTILIQHIHPVSEIQNGLATSAQITSLQNNAPTEVF